MRCFRLLYLLLLLVDTYIIFFFFGKRNIQLWIFYVYVQMIGCSFLVKKEEKKR